MGITALSSHAVRAATRNPARVGQKGFCSQGGKYVWGRIQPCPFAKEQSAKRLSLCRFSVCTVLELEEGNECVIVGTIYKHMKLKPCVLDEYSKERTAVPLVNPHNFVHQDDYLVLEDESGRVKLAGDPISPSVYVTGAGDFLVLDVLEAGLPPQIDSPLKSISTMKALKESLRVPDRLGWNGDPCASTTWDAWEGVTPTV